MSLLMVKYLKIAFQAAIFCIAAFSYAQNAPLNKFEKLVNEKKVLESSLALSKINKNSLDPAEIAKYNYLKANYYLLENKDNLAFSHYIISKQQYKKLDSLDKVAQINIDVVSLLVSIEKNEINHEVYLNEYLDYARKKNNPTYLSQAYMQIGKSLYVSNTQTALDYFKKALSENLKTNDEVYTARIYQNIGATYASDNINKLDSALYVYEKALRIYKQKNLTEYIFYIYTNKGVAYSKKKDYNKAFDFFFKADSITLGAFSTKKKIALYGYIADTYEKKGDYKNALIYMNRLNAYKEILNENEQKKAIKEIDTKYKTQEKEIENLNLKNKLQTNRIIVYSIVGLLLVTLTIGILALKNISKKKKIAEQEKQIETQKLEKTLKEQELHDIDLILESQEKERQQIANELHDDLGSMLATLKLNFQNLKRNENSAKSEINLYEKTDDLIEEAYQKVRNISHLKNLGVVGSQGLLVAVKKMAEKMSVLERLKINVIPFGLTERLDNQTEVSLFRMIQELCTNIIKHSGAKEVNIYLTQHNPKEINIIIEDNGTGFDPKKTTQNAGIGLKSIEKKVEQMGGTFTIDSILTKGTTIIIDLPL
ncbi:signal transduction histidine kinase [Flavobacterium arsenatis]|uniref:Oxygen sensor histidine kinase NreB n=1 Tax=Flavobacterium arsenatis TaxID=1484332 RepID=A0ABU1TPT7_9FLAO|nr:sensor histidine kinase [Flavobacterium arsenatis]MDR6967989.1 signal transduction histidine kinase [Flavobacterium arsenatis]